MDDHKGLPVHQFPAAADWDAWLAANGAVCRGLWLRFAKKGSADVSVFRTEAIETALAHGWIDGQLDKAGPGHWLIRFTPRGSRSKWSQNNRTIALALIETGRMRPAGLAEVERARADGRWDAAYAPQSRMEVPGDLAAALQAAPEAKAFFETLTGPNRYAVLYRIGDAKTQKTRAARVERFVAMLARGETVHPRKEG